MARVRKHQPTLDSIFFATPEQKLLRFLLSEPTTSFNMRAISSKLKGVRGLGGIEGITRILTDLETIGLVEFVDNRRAIRAQDEHSAIRVLKVFSALCDLEGLRALLEPVSTKGILFGSRATGRARSDSDYDLFVVSDHSHEIAKVTSGHPLGKLLEVVTWTQADYDEVEKRDPSLAQKLARGIVLWGPSW